MATYILTAKHDINIGNQRIDHKQSFTVVVSDKFGQSSLFTNPQCKMTIGSCIACQSGIPASKIPLGIGYWDVKKL